ncbi:MAG: hypothetical protein NC081_01545 [Roseburia sp.]|nr:hypothetical protein [Roseburia sp.]
MREKSKKRNIIWPVLKSVLFLLLFFALGFFVNSVLQQKWNFEDNKAAQQIVQGYYEEEDNTLDVLYLGASTVRNAISPLEIFHKYGITGYSRASSIQIPEVSYYFLLETLEKQDLKAVVLDVTMLNQEIEKIPELEAKMHEAVDYMPWSEYKKQLIAEVSQNRGFSPTGFFFPLYVYHDRWEELAKEDFTKLDKIQKYVYKGQYPTIDVKSYHFGEHYMETDSEKPDEEYLLSDLSKEYFQKMIRICEEKGIALILMKAPGANWNWTRHRTIQDFADANGIDYIDFCNPELLQEIQFDASTDFADEGMHVNISGSKKISDYIGAYLVEKCHMENKKDNPQYSEWEKDYKLYKRLLTDFEMSRQSEFYDFLNCLQGEDYFVLVSTRNDTAKLLSKDIKAMMGELGLNGDSFENSFQSYIAVIDNGNVIYEEHGEEQIDYSGILDGHMLRISSYANAYAGNRASIYIDGENYSTNKAGFNFVVYDKELQMVVCTKSFNTGYNGKAYEKPVFSQDKSLLALHEDPVGYLKKLRNNDRYISFIGIRKDAAKYLPESVDKRIKKMNLEGFRGQQEQPYIAVVNGSQVLYEELGEKREAIEKQLLIDGMRAQIISSSEKDNPMCKVIINEYEMDCSGSGLFVVVYDKTLQRVVDKTRFVWTKNYFSEEDLSSIEDLDAYLKAAENQNFEIMCLYRATENSVTEETETLLKESGFHEFSADNNYVGVKQNDVVTYQLSQESHIDYRFKQNKINFLLRVRDTNVTLRIGKMEYKVSDRQGVTTVVYDTENGAILSMRTWE